MFKGRGTELHVTEFVNMLKTITRRRRWAALSAFRNCSAGPIRSSFSIFYSAAGFLWFRKAAVFAPSSTVGRKNGCHLRTYTYGLSLVLLHHCARRAHSNRNFTIGF